MTFNWSTAGDFEGYYGNFARHFDSPCQNNTNPLIAIRYILNVTWTQIQQIKTQKFSDLQKFLPIFKNYQLHSTVMNTCTCI